MALRRSMGRPGLPLLLPPLGLPLAALASLLALVKLTVAQGQPVKLNCSVEGLEEPDIQLVKDGPVIQNLDQLYTPVSKQHWIGFLSLKSVERSDAASTGASQKIWQCHPMPLSNCLARLWVPLNLLPLSGGEKLSRSGDPAPMFSCEAHNLKCLASSRIATVHLQALPAAPFIITVTKLSSSNISVAWMPGSCTVQVTQLVPAISYSLRVHCANALGPSPYADWVPFQTKGLAAASTPQNPHAICTDSGLILEWEEVIPEGPLEVPLGPCKLSWVQDSGTQDELTVEGSRTNLTGWDTQKNLIICVCVSNAVGCGPWSQPLVVSSHDHAGQQGPPHSRTSWVPVVLGVLTALVTAAALAFILLRKRWKETRFGQGFDCVMARGEPAVYFRAVQPECIEAALDSLSINSGLKEKQGCAQPRAAVHPGQMLGKGECGSLKQEDGSFVKDFLREAACMKEFDHPHVAKLVGVSLWSRAKGCHPIPMVILPFMKHGDLHTFLLTSQIGENPFTLIRFMVDIACGMEYLNLAARNCMLAVDMTVSVADFGLSWKIYSGDYYRQGCASKLPVSDVWAFRVTMWEIMTRGQTPYAGIKNAEIYNYLIGGNRLKQLPEPSDDLLYDLMYQCWSADPKQRPSFTCLRMKLESILGQLSVLSASQDPLYINIKRAEEPTAGGSLELPGGDQPYSGAGDGSGMGAVGGTPRLAEQPGQADPLNETQRLLLQQQGQQPHSSC
uniref:Receptor protein-tyrosine kinase n=1 Tax=Cercocebus atys TaxID=9531 RepID=A0A2K5MDR2_CERAT